MLKSMLAAAALVAVAAPAARAQTQAPGVSLVIRDGRVTLRAEEASIRQILAEWERQGGVKVSGVEKLAGAPLTLTIADMPEKQALEIVMRGVPGYMAIDRAGQPASASASRFDRVVVMARATTPVSAPAAAGPMPSRGLPSPAAEPAAFQQTMPQAFVQPVMGDDNPATPERNDVDQFTQVEPPMPEAPVASPYPNAFPGSPYPGAAAGVGPYGGSAAAAAAAGMTGAAPPETQFDYANPQKYFEQRRQQAQPPTSVPSAVPGVGPGVGQTGRPVNGPTATPSVPGTLARPGFAPTPAPGQAPPTPAQGEFFNPYNLPPDWVPPPPVPNAGTPPVEPDRAKYANPYEQPRPPEE